MAAEVRPAGRYASVSIEYRGLTLGRPSLSSVDFARFFFPSKSVSLSSWWRGTGMSEATAPEIVDVLDSGEELGSEDSVGASPVYYSVNGSVLRKSSRKRLHKQTPYSRVPIKKRKNLRSRKTMVTRSPVTARTTSTTSAAATPARSSTENPTPTFSDNPFSAMAQTGAPGTPVASASAAASPASLGQAMEQEPSLGSLSVQMARMTQLMHGMEGRLGDKFGASLADTNKNLEDLSKKVDSNNDEMKSYVMKKTDESGDGRGHAGSTPPLGSSQPPTWISPSA